MTAAIAQALRAPSFEQDSQWPGPTYATKPRSLLDAAAARIEELEAEVQALHEEAAGEDL